MESEHTCRVLLIYPRFAAETFWNFAEACELMGARYPAAPLGLITVAALLPPHWEVRLVDRNTGELTEADLHWADIVMTGGMLPQQADCLAVIELSRRHNRPVVVGGPDPTSSPHVYEHADFRVLGEAEGILDEFITAWNAGKRSGTFVAPKFQIDVTKSPIPRFDLIKFEHYLYASVQYSRGCPFTCEFCDIIELYGRVPRAKTTPQMLAELDRLYALGYRGHVDFVDDNLIGNKKALKQFLPSLKAWQEKHDYPFEFSTEASVNLSDDAELMCMMRDAGFFGLFVGIESPDPETLVMMKKKQNTRRNLVDSIHRIYRAGMFVTGGFIIGFDSEKSDVGDSLAQFIEYSAIPVAMVGLLYALPNTQLTRRLTKEGRLHANHDVGPVHGGDQCTDGLNFDTLRPRQAVLRDYKRVLQAIYEPAAYAGRLQRLVSLLDRSASRRGMPAGDPRGKFDAMQLMQRIVTRLPEAREPFLRVLKICARENPDAMRIIVGLMALYLHLGPFSRQVIAAIDRRIEAYGAAALGRVAMTHSGVIA
ncbi:MAG TPA: B12-binding domain-containing radical SAM protein [Pseudolabrys sp.]|nr:B12-binding domain-containing radical SAM protein [Pseudolabrys sp.]